MKKNLKNPIIGCYRHIQPSYHKSPPVFHFPEIQKKWKTGAKRKNNRTNERKRDFKMAGGEKQSER